MLSPELRKLKNNLVNSGTIYGINNAALLKELQQLERGSYPANRSISLPGSVCPTCGRPLENRRRR